jgi:hypothetical protein
LAGPRKPFYKRWWFINLVLLVVLTSCTTAPPPPSSERTTSCDDIESAKPSVLSADGIRMSAWVIEQDTVLVALKAHLDGEGKGAGDKQSLKAVIYTDDGKRPGTLVNVSEQINIPDGADRSWFTFRFENPVRLEQGAYWFGIFAGQDDWVAQFYWTERKDALWIARKSYQYPNVPYTVGKQEPPTEKDDANREMCWMMELE